MLPFHGCQKLRGTCNSKSIITDINCSLVIILVDSCVPGDVVTITGIVKVTGTEERKLSMMEAPVVKC